MKREKLPGTMFLAYFGVGRVQWTKMKRGKLPGDHVISILKNRTCPVD